jgi:peptidoglycan/xylan/chitin deacetylase (PgdA/CDA1 family)
MHGDQACMVLTYHSISSGAGPTNIPPDIFAMQMAEVAEQGYRTLSAAEFIAWHDGGAPTAERQLLITFDDAFRDFAEAAAPILARHGLRALVFVPTAKLGGDDDWEAPDHRRALMDWGELGALQGAGVEFGSHSRTHRDLRKLGGDALTEEIEGSKRELSERLGSAVSSFAAPFGTSNEAVRAAIAPNYAIAFGTRLDLARQGRDRYDIPRLDMHYFRDRRRWRGLLEGERHYLRRRQLLRAVRERVSAMIAKDS